MQKLNLHRRPTRHPAVVDLLGGVPTTTVSPGTATVPGGAEPPRPAPRPGGGGLGRWRPGKKALAAAGVAVAVVAGGAVLTQISHGGTNAANVAAAPTAVGVPALHLSSTPPPPTPPSAGGVCSADRGDQNSAVGVIEAFEYAYYATRDAAAARALATPTSSVQPVPQLQQHIDAVPVGTNYCLRTVPLSAGVYLVNLTLMQPGQPARSGTLTVTTTEVNARWYVEDFT